MDKIIVNHYLKGRTYIHQENIMDMKKESIIAGLALLACLAIIYYALWNF